ncbi:armadillo repeat-containing protein 7 isoform X1 [Poecilia reticulata]|uniref:Armadillo repeat containing 7 n=1 Tax=Poecilia reticulata TaxID=8081 RepID=A0A3P9PDU1_POERE|nr:PREDICTED: armadillo repeat-containing protein 7 isoform X1 [Poecilia reticulata]
MSSTEAPERFEYLQSLVTEFQDTDSEEAKEQVLANLANFAYDPKNMEYLRELQVPDLFLDMLTEENENFVEFGMGGLCNLSMDPKCREVILQSGGISLVTNCLSNRREETVLSAVTTLMNLATPATRPQISGPGILQCMLRFSLAESPRLRNLAAVFLQDCCSEEQVRQAQQQTEGQQTAVGIPLPKE